MQSNPASQPITRSPSLIRISQTVAYLHYGGRKYRRLAEKALAVTNVQKCAEILPDFQKKMRWGRGDDLSTLFERYNNLNDGRLKSHWMIYGWQRVTSVAGCQLSAVKRWKLSDETCSICQYATVSCGPGIEWGAWGVSSRCQAWTQPP